MTAVYANADDPDHDLVDRLIAHHPPASDDALRTMETIREMFRTVGHFVIERVPRTEDRKRALYKIHEASQASIGALACNQEEL